MTRAPAPPLSIAPMMQRTDRHFRVLLRQLSRRTLLYTEMVVTGAILRGDADRHPAFYPLERPLALQLGGDDPVDLAACARIAEDYGYDEVNLNVGCPSDKVQSGNFGVCLMGDPDRVADAVAAMRAACGLPVTVKHRIGFDDRDHYDHMRAFVDRVAEAGCDRFSVHARKALLQGLSPKENRDIPPLRYEDVYRLKAERPDLQVEINGGIRDLYSALAQLAHVDAVMIGRAAWDDHWILAQADSRFFGTPDPSPDPQALVAAMERYATDWLASGPERRLGPIVRPLLNLFPGRPGARRWRRRLSDGGFTEDALPGLITEAWQALVGAGLAAR